MPLRPRRKVRRLEKLENFCRTATTRKILATRRDESDHACAILSLSRMAFPEIGIARVTLLRKSQSSMQRFASGKGARVIQTIGAAFGLPTPRQTLWKASFRERNLKPRLPGYKAFRPRIFRILRAGPLRFRKVCQLCGEAPCDQTLCPLRCFYPNKKSRERVRSRRLPGEE
jgi:hypothetical protein